MSKRPPRAGPSRRRPPPRRRWLIPAVALGGLVLAAAAILLLTRDQPGAPSSWATLGTADVHALAFDPTDPQHLYFGHHNGLLESTDGGRTWQASSLSGADAMNVPIVDGERFQIAGHEVHLETIDGGASWQPVPNDLPGLDLHAFAVDPADPDHAWAFAVGFGLYESTDAGRHWQQRQPGNWAALTAYRDDGTTVLLGIGPEGLVRSNDGGTTWTLLAYPGAPLAALAASRDGSVLYAATSAGLRRSSDGGATWSATGFTAQALAVAVAPGDPMDVVLVDEATRFFRSSDGGGSWPAP
ncbi:MAG: YCF48-related protein [Candidatus Limnocylindria bacterium]